MQTPGIAQRQNTTNVTLLAHKIRRTESENSKRNNQSLRAHIEKYALKVEGMVVKDGGHGQDVVMTT